MNKILLMLLIFVLSLISYKAHAYTGVWKYGAVVTNPVSATVFVSVTLPASGSQASPPSANYVVGMQLYCSVQATYEFQVLNASSVVQVTIPYVCSATQPNNIVPGNGLVSFPIQDGWTLQIIPAAGFTGSGSAQIFYAIEGLK